MNDEELLLQAVDCKTLYFDGLGAFRKINGVMRCVGFIVDSGAQYNLIMSLSGVENMLVEARRALNEPAAQNRMWRAPALAH